MNHSTLPFVFPDAKSNVLPDPSLFFSPNLLSYPLPTNSSFQNFALKNGDQPEFIHPYLIKLSSSSLSLSYPFRVANSSVIYQVFVPDLTITKSGNQAPNSQDRHVNSSFSDLSVTIDLPSSNLRFFLVRGSPFITFSVLQHTNLSISTIHAILSFSSNTSKTKYTIKLNNDQTWLIFASSSISFSHDTSSISSDSFSGVIRIATLPDPDVQHQAMLDRFSSCYPISGEALFTNPFSLEYKWETKGHGDLLLLAHPLHQKLLSSGSSVLLNDIRYKSIDGDLVGVVGDSWKIRVDPFLVTWHSSKGVTQDSCPKIISALSKDVESLDSTTLISTSSSYHYGKSIARAARLALIAEEVRYLDAIPRVTRFLKETIEPWLEGTFEANGFIYDPTWGGLLTKKGAIDSDADSGFGVYNDHHYHSGYFLYAIAVLVKIDPAWGRKFKPHAYAMMSDFMSIDNGVDSRYTRLRCFDLYKLHSWAGGLREYTDGRNQQSTSEAVNAYYSAALMGLAYGDIELASLGSTIAALEMKAAKTWWHVRGGENMYEDEFCKGNKVVGVLWANKRDSGLWFAPPDWKECRLGVEVLPIVPITEVLFSDVGFAKDVVNWSLPALEREGVEEGWKGFVYGVEGIYDKGGALDHVGSLKGFDDGNSLSNLLWWIYSRGN